MKWPRKWTMAEKHGAQKQKKCFLKFRFYHVQRKAVILKGQTETLYETR